MKLHRVAALLVTQASEAFFHRSPFLRQRHYSTSPLKMNSTTSDLNQVKQRIIKAISIGATAYNSGDVQKCATIYTETAREISPLLPRVFQSKLQDEVGDDNCDRTMDTNYDAKAWALRRIFDSILDHQLPVVPQNYIGDKNISFEPFTPAQLGQPIKVMDNVMGGISNGTWDPDSNSFSGVTSLANNGGFASIRWRFASTQNWSYAKGIYIKGLTHSTPEEHTFSILLKDDMCERIRFANFKVVFANPEKVDQPLLIPFSVFNQMEQMGSALVGSPAFNPVAVTEIGLMAIKPTVVGDFWLGFSEWGLYT
ncbi:hypothetical protein HJC23_011676 [Cyclotella cryptica]|uniref:NADH:ubiquinone oxidoreductase intermediate-associated protein 30 domain-containing protein n=1 Tax=Cyclotella cryptica TaxID=29204 RepID=A0ABD3QJ27_9STRA|eukprot:CCRYP_004776-RA/>CCRYP_004776-RA protein AED:0.05 eAED:0.04 QI:0/-1/0/1/-1/1/1/0/310